MISIRIQKYEAEIISSLIVSCLVWPWILVLFIACNTEVYKLIKYKPLKDTVYQHGHIYIKQGEGIWKDSGKY